MITAAPQVTTNRVQFRADRQRTTVAVQSVAGPPASMRVTVAATKVVAGEKVRIQVSVQDQNGNPVPETTVNFSPLSEGMTLTAEKATTNAQGQASTVVRTNSKAGINRFRVSVAGLKAQVQEIQGIAGAPAQLTLQAESTKTVAGGHVAITAQVRDAHGNPVAAVPIRLTASPAGATLEATTLTTDANGIAHVTLHTALKAGKNEVQATVADLSPAHLTVTGQPPVALQIIPQTATVAMHGSQRFRALAMDADGHTVEAAPRWSVVGEGGTIDAEGTFTATRLGSEVVLATYAGLTTGAQLTVVPGEAAIIEVTPPEATVVSGTTQQFQAAVFNAHRYPLDVTPTWEVTNEIGTIDASGLFTATKAGTGEILATANGATGRAQVTVTPGELAAISVTPTRVMLQAGEELQLQANGYDATGNTIPIEPSWHLTANLGELDPSGLFRARHVGTGHIRVEAGAKPVTVEIPVEVVPAALARIDMEPQTLTLSAGEEFQYTATGYDTFGNPVDITPKWQLTTDIGSIDEEGHLIARRAGSARVLTTVGEITGEASVVVKPGPLASLTVDPGGPLTLAAGDTVSLAVVGHDAYGNVVALTPTWSQKEPLGTLSPDGRFRAEKVGSTELIVESDNQRAVVQVTVTPGKLAKIVVSPAEVTLPAGDTLTFHATGLDAYDNKVEIEPSWRVVNNLGEISQTGEFKALQARTGQIVAMAAGISGSARVTVEAGPLALLEITPQRLDLTAGETVQISVVGYDAYGNPLPTQPIWQVTEGMGTITPDGLLTAKKAGKGRVIGAVGHLAVIADLQVKPGAVSTLRIDLPTTRVASGHQQAFTVQGFDLGGNPVPVEPLWEVQGDIGSIDPNGLFTGTLVGSGTVMAKVGPLQAEAEVIVEPGEVTTLRVAPESATLRAGERLELHSEAFDAAGNRSPTTPEWSVENDLGTISPDGVFHAQHAGSGRIIATIGKVQQSIAIQVQAGPLASIRLQPAKLAISAGEKLDFTAKGYDAYGNPVGIEPTWSLQGGIGEIDPTQGTFQATTVGSGTVIAVVGTIAGLSPVKVAPGPVARLQLEPQSVALTAGEEVSLTLTAYDAHNNVTHIDTDWSLTEPLGELKEGWFQAQAVGTTEIIVTGGDLLARTVVQVRPGPVVRLLVTPEQVELPAGKTRQFRALGYDTYGNVREVTAAWELSGDIGQLTPTGEFTAGKQGEGLIVARFDKFTSKAEVRVVPGTPQRLVITPAHAQVPSTMAQEFSVIGLDAGGNPRPVTVNWAMTRGIGSLDQSGHFTATRVGTGTVVAYNDTLLQTAEVSVTPGPVALLFVTPQRSTVRAGETLQFHVQGFDANQNPLSALQPHWSVIGNIGTIDPATGVFKATLLGWGKVQATLEDTQASADVMVTHGTPDVRRSRIIASRVNLLADGETAADIIILVRDHYGNPVPEAQVTLVSSRGDDIDQPPPSNQQGVAVGRIRSSKPGQSEINAVVESGRISNSLRLTFSPPVSG
jgi:plastocyanin